MPGNGMPNRAKSEKQYMIRQKVEALSTWIEGFLRDCRSGELSEYTVTYYARQLAHFNKYAGSHGVIEVTDITPDLIREYLIDLKATGHNKGGRHAKYRALRRFLRWWEEETEPAGWINPASKVRPPKVKVEPIPGATLEDIRAMIDTCDSSFTGTRDKAILSSLLDTAARIREFLLIDLDDVDLISGRVFLRASSTKAKQSRVVSLGQKARRALRAYLKIREDSSLALWVTSSGDRLAVSSIQGMLQRRGQLAGLKNIPSAHDFRRCCALELSRSGMSDLAVARYLGHSDSSTLPRYIKHDETDMQAAPNPSDKL